MILDLLKGVAVPDMEPLMWRSTNSRYRNSLIKVRFNGCNFHGFCFTDVTISFPSRVHVFRSDVLLPYESILLMTE